MAVNTKIWLHNLQFASIRDKKDFIYTLASELFSFRNKQKAEKLRDTTTKPLSSQEKAVLDQLESMCFEKVVPTKRWLREKSNYLQPKVRMYYVNQKYNGRSFYWLIRCIRNTTDHYLDQQTKLNHEEIKAIVGSDDYEVTQYFLNAFPNLIPVLTQFVEKNKHVLTETYKKITGYPKLPMDFPTSEDVILGLADSLHLECQSEQLLCGFENLWYTNEQVIFLSPPPDYKMTEDLIHIKMGGQKVEYFHERNEKCDHKLTIGLTTPYNRNLLIVLSKRMENMKHLITESRTIICITADSTDDIKEQYTSLCETEDIDPKPIPYTWKHYSTDAYHYFGEKFINLAGKSYKFSDIFYKRDGTLEPSFEPYIDDLFLKKLRSTVGNNNNSAKLWEQSFGLGSIPEKQIFKLTKRAPWNIITGRPYVGKSVYFKQHARKSENPVFIINIEDKPVHDFRFSTLSEFMEVFAGKTKLEIELFKHMCQNSKKVELVLDGLENLLVVDNEVVDSKLVATLITDVEKFSEDKKNLVVWIVTRPHCANQIRKRITETSYHELKLQNKQEEKNLVQSFVSSEFKNGEGRKIRKYSNNVLECFEDSFQMTVFSWGKIIQRITQTIQLDDPFSLDELSRCEMLVDIYLENEKQKISREFYTFLYIELALGCFKKTVADNPRVINSIQSLETEIRYVTRSLKSLNLKRVDIGLIYLKDTQNWKNTFSFYDKYIPNYFVAMGLLEIPISDFESLRHQSINSRRIILTYLRETTCSEPGDIQHNLIQHFYDKMALYEEYKTLSKTIAEHQLNISQDVLN